MLCVRVSMRMNRSPKETGNLAHLIDQVDSIEDVSEWGQRAKANMKQNFTWEKIVGEYEELFLS